MAVTQQESNATSVLPRESIGWEHDHISGPVSRELSLKSHITGPPSGLADGENIPCMEDKVSVSQ